MQLLHASEGALSWLSLGGSSQYTVNIGVAARDRGMKQAVVSHHFPIDLG